MLLGKHINRYYLKYAFSFLAGIAALLMVDYVQLVVPGLYRMVVNGMNEGFVEFEGELVKFDMNFLLDKICLPMIVVILAMIVGRFLWRICFFGAGIKMVTDMRNRMFGHCRNLSQEFYHTNKVGDLMSYFTNDLETVQDCFGWGVMMLCDALFLGVLATVKMAKMNVLLTILSYIPMALLLAASIIIGKYITIKWDARQEAFSQISDFSQESFSGISVIKAFVKEGKELAAFSILNRKNEDTNVDYTKLSVTFNIVITLFIESVMCIILGYGGYLVHQDVFNAGQLIEFIGYFNSIIWPIMAVSELIDMRSRGKASLDRIGKLLEEKIDVCDADDVYEIDGLRGDIEFRNLTFRYPSREYDILSDVSLKISAGENVGIIGRTGSGKTTLVDLILRTYNVPEGTLFLDGHDVCKIPIKTVRANAAYVPQDGFLFSDTIQNNIKLAADAATPEEVRTAATLSDIDENISEFPLAYETVLGERGVTVSGGQKQRISIARALMKNAPILILDDAVSAVDVKTEKTILDNLRRERAGKTTILTAHRISTVEHMDKVVFVDEGKVLAVGPHKELVETCPEYRNMVELQKLDDEGGAANA